jgi:hypothetical protein
MGMLKLVDRPRLGRGEINSYKFESYYPYICYLYIVLLIAIFVIHYKHTHNYKYVVD